MSATGFLTLSRRHGQGITMSGPQGETIQLIVGMEQSMNRVRVSIAAPETWRILRSELLGTDAPDSDMGGRS